MMKRSMRAYALLLLLCMLVGLCLPSCARKEEEVAEPTLCPNEKDGLTLSFSPSAELLDAHRGKTVSVYELAPGETVADLQGRLPVATGKLTAKTEIHVPLEPHDRIYSTFLPVVGGGFHLTDAPVGLTNPAQLAELTAEFPHANRIKGLAAADEELSRALYSAHTVVSLSASALTAGDGAVSASLAGTNVALDSVTLSETDRAVLAATEAGMQVSLSLLPDAPLSVASYAAILELLASRYVGGECGFVSAILIGKTRERTAENEIEAAVDASFSAALLRCAEIALCSRYANGRVYLTVGGELAAMEAYLSQVKTYADGLGCKFGVALAPDCDYPAKDARLSIFSLEDAVKSLRALLGRNTRFAVVELSFPAVDPDLQAALCTYAYRASMNSKVDMMIYSAQADDLCGLYSEGLTERPAARAFRLLDTDENAEGERLAATLLANEWEELNSVRSTRFAVTGIANVGSTEDRGTEWIGFGSATVPAFSLAGNGYPPTVRRSESLGVPVLTANLTEATNGVGSGFRCTLPSKSIEDAYVLAARILPQSSPDFPADTATVTLLLDGTSASGQALNYSASVSVACNEWQSLTFQIRAFSERLNPSAPVTLSLLMQPEYIAPEQGAGGAQDSAASDENALPHYALWLHLVNVREAAPDHTLPTVLALVLLGFAVALCTVLLLRRRRANARTR